MYSDSGVVTRMCGGVRRMRSRSAAGVSPVRTASRMPTSGRPIATSPARMPASGSCRFLRMSLDSAFSGDTYSTWTSSASPLREALQHQLVDRRQEGRERLARAGGRGDQRMAALRGDGPGAGLDLGRAAEAALQPAGNGRVERKLGHLAIFVNCGPSGGGGSKSPATTKGWFGRTERQLSYVRVGVSGLGFAAGVRTL